MDFEKIWYITRKKARRIFKKIKKFFKKLIRWFRRYIRLLVRHTKAKDYSVLIYTIGALIALILVIILFGKIFSAIGGKDKTTTETVTEMSTPSDATEDPYTEQQRALVEQCKTIYNANSDYLILVNNDNSLAETYTFEHHTLNCGLDIDERCYNDFLNMSNAMNEQGMYYNVVSAYRSRETQQQVIDAKIQEYIATGLTEEEAAAKTYESIRKAGYSEHETGLAVDLVPQGITDLYQEVASDPMMQWLAANSYQYGFILRYPSDKENITATSYEPWHFRYVGIEAATFMYNNNLTLEEFYQLLAQ